MTRAEKSAQRELEDVEAVFKALAHATRRHVLVVLHFRGGEMTAGEIAARFSCSWPTTTRHLRVLREAGLVRVEPRGRERVYRIDRERLGGVVGGWMRWLETEPLVGPDRPVKGEGRREEGNPPTPAEPAVPREPGDGGDPGATAR